jgi:hypothetical protein
MAIDFTTGVLQIANFFLAIVAGLIAATLFEISAGRELRAWKPLAVALVFFALEEIFGALRSFGIYSNPWITHVIPSVILGFLIWSLILQLEVVKEARR